MALIIPKLRNFLLTYPGLEPGSQISVLPFSPNVTEGNGLSYTGQGAPAFTDYIDGNTAVSFRESYSLDILRHLIDEISNEEVTEFIRDFEKWVTKQSALGKTPRFGDPNYKERMWAQGGILYMVQMTDTPIPYAAYRTNIIIQYQELYKESEDY